jgi:hypothetical protein
LAAEVGGVADLFFDRAELVDGSAEVGAGAQRDHRGLLVVVALLVVCELGFGPERGLL